MLSTELTMCKSCGCRVAVAKPKAHGMEILKLDFIRE